MDTECMGRCCKRIIWLLKSQLGLLIMLVAYAFVGAAIFEAIERPARGEFNTTQERNDLMLVLWEKARSGQLSQHEFAINASAEVLKFENEVRRQVGKCVLPEDGRELEPVWTFWSALLFCGTVFTTIGYGYVTPQTTWGRITCIIYASAGIPLCLIVLGKLGHQLMLLLIAIWRLLYRIYCRTGMRKCARRINAGLRKLPCLRRSDEEIPGEPQSTLTVEDFNEDEFTPSVFVAVLIVLTYVLLGAGMYTQWEAWSYFDACYFIFQSLTTIGFGDLSPSHPKFFIASSVYILCGLALMSMLINILSANMGTRLAAIEGSKKDKAKHDDVVDEKTKINDVSYTPYQTD